MHRELMSLTRGAQLTRSLPNCMLNLNYKRDKLHEIFSRDHNRCNYPRFTYQCCDTINYQLSTLKARFQAVSSEALILLLGSLVTSLVQSHLLQCLHPH